MPDLSELIREYGELLTQERWIEDRKTELRSAIAEEMARQSVNSAATAHGTAERTPRFKLLPRRDQVLGLLSSEDLFPFATFTPPRVKEILVPKFGRETLIPLFEIQKSESLVIKRPPGTY